MGKRLLLCGVFCWLLPGKKSFNLERNAKPNHEMTCFLLFDKLCDYTAQNFVVGSSNNDDMERKQIKKGAR